MRRARFSRREDASPDLIAQAAKVSGDVPKSQGDVAGDVFEEDPTRLHFADDPGDLGPEVSGIVGTAPISGEAEGLAGITGRDDMNAAAPRSAVERSQIVPDRCRSQCLVFHPGHERGRRVGFPLDVTHSSIAGLGDMQAEVETSIACAERDAPEFIGAGWLGTKSHKARSFRPLGWRSVGGSVASGCSGRCICDT